MIGDPAVQLAEAQRRRHDALVAELHDAQRTGTGWASALNALYSQMTGASGKVKDAVNVPPAVKAQFDAFNKDFDALRVKFGVGPGAAAAGRGGGGGRGGADPDNALGRTTALKGLVMGVWEAPSESTVRQSTEAKAALQKAVTEAGALLTRATAVSGALKPYDITLTVPAAPK